MKKLLLSLIVITASVILFAQSPNQLKYQAVLRNTDGTIMADENVTIVISILKSDLTTTVFEETHTTSTNAQGLININIGSKEDLSVVNWELDEYFLELIVNGNIFGTSQLLSVPYALHAKTAESISGGVSEIDPTFTAWDKSTGVSITESQITDFQTYLTSEADGSVSNEIELPTSGNVGDMNYWNGSAWVTIPATANNGATLKMIGNVPTWAGGTPPPIGSSNYGGIIAYIFVAGDPGYVEGETHGLVAAPSDQSEGIQWYNGSNTTTGATGTAIGTGSANTNAIVANQGAGIYAAQICADLVIDGYDDWYLPSKDELYKLYLNRFTMGGFSFNEYWSSSEEDSNTAYAHNFFEGWQFTTNKSSNYKVRAVRDF